MTDRTLPILIGVLATIGADGRLRAEVPTARESIRQQYVELNEQLVADLEPVARFCEERDLDDAARSIRALATRGDSDDGTIVVQPLPGETRPEISKTLPEDEYAWRSRVRRIREEHAGKLYLLARRTLRAGFPSRAYGMVREVAEFDPDHESARKLLGDVLYRDEWVTPFARSMMIKRHVWHERFGWLPRTYVERYEAGERRYGNEWISAEREADIRRDFRNAWTIRTAHYLVKTNHSLEEGVRIAKALELYHGFFKQVFAAFFVSPEQQASLFESGTSRRDRTAPQPHTVYFFRSKEDYVAALQEKFPQIAITNGLYQSGDRIAYFFHDPTGRNTPVIFHEATHQLFYESDPLPRDVGVKAHFWIIEGIACYMESFDRTDGGLTCGDPQYVRFDNARFRLQNGDYEPFGEFSSLGMRDFQNGDVDTLGKRYSQSSGLAHFLMHYDGGRYRDALITHLADLYSPQRLDRARTIPELLRVNSAELDGQYRAFLEAQSRELATGAAEGMR